MPLKAHESTLKPQNLSDLLLLPPTSEPGALGCLGEVVTRARNTHSTSLSMTRRSRDSVQCPRPFLCGPQPQPSSMDASGCRAVWGSWGCHDDKPCSSWTSSLPLPAVAEHIPGFCSRTPGSAQGSRSQTQGHFLTVSHILLELSLTLYSASSIAKSTYLEFI